MCIWLATLIGFFSLVSFVFFVVTYCKNEMYSLGARKRIWFHNSIISSPARSNRNSRNIEKVSIISVRSRDCALISEQAYNLSLSHLQTPQREKVRLSTPRTLSVCLDFVCTWTAEIVLQFSSVKVYAEINFKSFSPINMTLYHKYFFITSTLRIEMIFFWRNFIRLVRKLHPEVSQWFSVFCRFTIS